MGSWKSLIEMENSINIEELFALHRGLFRAEHRRNKFAAALKGVDIDDFDADPNDEDPFERIQRQAQADLAGKSEEEFTFEMMGIEFDEDDD